MRAYLLNAFGGPARLQLTEIPEPTPAADQLLVRVAAIGINSLETKMRSGGLERHFPTPLPAILGKEFAGTVVHVGAGVAGFSVGDRVVGTTASGAYAEYAVARPEAITIMPAALPFEQAATLPVAVETATRALSELGVERGWVVVVNGAAGNVGSAAVQLLVRRGVTVIGTAATADHRYLTSLGATPVVYGDGVTTRIRDVAPRGVDAVFDAAGHGFAATAIELTGDPKRVLTIADFEAASLGIRISVGSRTPSAAPLVPVLPLAAAGSFRLRIGEIFQFAEMVAAHDAVDGGKTRGKIIVTVPAASRKRHGDIAWIEARLGKVSGRR